MDAQLADYRQQFERIATEAKDLTSGLTEAQFNWRPSPGEWSIEECISHLISVGTAELETIIPAVAQARAKGITGSGPFEMPAWERFIVRETEPPARHTMRSPKRFGPIHGQPITGVLPTFLHLQRQFTLEVERADGLHLRRVKVPTAISSLLKLSLHGTLAVVTAHERRHLAQARRVRDRLPQSAGA